MGRCLDVAGHLMDEEIEVLRGAARPDPLPPRPSRWALLVQAAQVAVAPIGVLLCLGLYLVFAELQDVEARQQAGEQRTYQTRAISCDLAKGIGVTEPQECSSPDVLPYRDPRVQPASSASSRATKEMVAVICAILARPGSSVVLSSDLCPE